MEEYADLRYLSWEDGMDTVSLMQHRLEYNEAVFCLPLHLDRRCRVVCIIYLKSVGMVALLQ